MKSIVVSCVLLIFLTVHVHSDDDHGENAVSFDKDTFDSLVEKERLFVMFFAPWCGHCKRLAPTWDDLAKETNVEGGQVTVGKVDCTVETALCSAQGVRGYPTVKFFNLNTEGEKYAKARTIDELRSFIEEQLGKGEEAKEETEEKEEEKAAAELPTATDGLYQLTDDDFDTHVAKGHHFIKFYAPWCGHCKRLAPTWDELAQANAGGNPVKISKIDCTKESKTCSKYGVRGYPTLIWFTNGEKNEDYRGGRTMDDFNTFITKKTSAAEQAKTSEDGKVPEQKEEVKEVKADLPTPKEGLYEPSNDNFAAHVAAGNHFIKFYAPWCGHCKNLAPTWDALAKENKDGKTVKISKVDCTVEGDVCKQYGVRGYPTLIWFADGKKKEEYNGARGLADLKKFITLQATVAPQEELKLAEVEVVIPTVTEGLYILTDDTFADHVAKGNHFIKFYAPWCGHCKKLAPTWDELAKANEDGSTVKISKIDCTTASNTCNKFDVKGYPSLLWFADGEKKQKYSGARSLENFNQFIREQTVMVEEDEEEMELVTLTKDDFQDSVSEDFTLVLFTENRELNAKVVSVFGKVSNNFLEKPEILVAMVECRRNVQLCIKQESRGPYPQVISYHNGNRIEMYKGEKTQDAVVNYIDGLVKKYQHDEL